MPYKGTDLEDKAGCGNSHGPLCSPLEPCGYDVSRGQANNSMVPPLSAPAPSAGGLPPTQFADSINVNKKGGAPFDTPMNGTTSIGATGNASGTGNKSKGDISSPWSGPFGEL